MATKQQQQPRSNANRENAQNAGKENEGSGENRELMNDYNELREDFQTFIDEVGTSVSTYCRKRPGVAACLLFGLGFYVGWKIKPW